MSQRPRYSASKVTTTGLREARASPAKSQPRASRRPRGTPIRRASQARPLPHQEPCPRARTLPHDAGKSSPILITSHAAAARTGAGFRDHARGRDHGRSPRSGQARYSVITPGTLITEHRTRRPGTDSSPGTRTLRHDARKGSPILITSHPTASIAVNQAHSHARRADVTVSVHLRHLINSATPSPRRFADPGHERAGGCLVLVRLRLADPIVMMTQDAYV